MTNAAPEIKTDYRTLQGVDHIEAAFARLQQPDLRGGLNRAPWIAAQCVELIYFNAAHLFDRVARLQDGGETYFPACLRLLAWITELLDLALGFSGLAAAGDRGRVEPDETDAWTSPAMRRFGDAYERAEHILLTRLRAEPQRFQDAISSGDMSDALAMSIQNLKNIFHLNSIISRDLATFGAGATDRSLTASDELERAVFGMGVEADGFLMQFRLLHQIPELCSLFIVELLEECHNELEDGRIENLNERLLVISNVFLLVIQCNRPLRNLMSPAEYYKIRHYFGQTSGAQSVAISKNLLGKSYLRFAELAQRRLSGSSPAPEAALVLRQVHAVSGMIVDWRRLHLGFPRNLLGGFQTASLAGTPDGLEAARSMAQQFVKKDPLRTAGDEAHLRTPAAYPGAALDHELLRLTATVTQAKYQDVQLRAARPRAERSVETAD